MKKYKALIERYDEDVKQALGRLYVLYPDNSTRYACDVLELPWMDNQRNISCIPVGTYQVVKHLSNKFGQCFWVQDVPGRSEILIHRGNYHTDIRGCILPGTDLRDINKDGLLDVVHSQDAMDDLLRLLPDTFELEIKSFV